MADEITTTEPTDQPPRSKVLPRLIEDEMRESFIDYSMSVIVQRALPDVRDGLKPVHRRILFAMHEAGLSPNRPYKKSATVVGDVLGKYHPHGDASVYDALVRMVQDFSLRYPLVDGQGNFGSVDGDPAAAYRYTEAKLAPIATEMLADIDKDTVDFAPNFDDRLEEPRVLPARIPNLLVNGSSGIAVGMATNIPPHNLREVADACIHLIENPDATVDDLHAFVKGPDFPTGGLIYGRDGIREAYETGRGRVLMRARAEIEEREGGKGERIVIREIPFQVNKSRLIEQIAELARDKKIEGIADLRDESDRDGMRIVVDLKRDAIPHIVLNQLFKHTQMQSTFGVIMLALVGGVPQDPHPARDALPLRGAPPRRPAAAHPVRAGQGAGARAHPGRPQDRRRQHRRGHPHHPRLRHHRRGRRARCASASACPSGRPTPSSTCGSPGSPAWRSSSWRRSWRRSAPPSPTCATSSDNRERRLPDHQGGAARGRRQVRRRAAHRHHGRHGLLLHRGPDRRRGDGHHRLPHRLHQARPGGHLPRPGARRARHQRHADQGRGLGRADLSGEHARLPDVLHAAGAVLLAQGARDPAGVARRAAASPS